MAESDEGGGMDGVARQLGDNVPAPGRRVTVILGGVFEYHCLKFSIEQGARSELNYGWKAEVDELPLQASSTSLPVRCCSSTLPRAPTVSRPAGCGWLNSGRVWERYAALKLGSDGII